jgi:hypothetical protein
MDSWRNEKGDTKTTVQWIGEASQTSWTVCPLPIFVTAQYSSDPPRSGTRHKSLTLLSDWVTTGSDSCSDAHSTGM